MAKKILVYGRQVSGLKSSYSVKTRNAVILAEELNADRLVFSNDRIKSYDYDVIIMTYSNRYTDWTTLRKFIKPDQNRFTLRTEYENVNNPGKVWKPYHEICNFEGGENYINTNLLIARNPNTTINKKYDCVYYSRYRKDRMKYAKMYLKEDIYLSTNSKNHKHFFHEGIKCKTIKQLSFIPEKETLNNFRYSLYIEDEYTHKVFNNLANRWYESGFCNNVVFFDVNCWNTIKKSEIAHFEDQIKDYIVTDYESLQAKIEYCNQDFEKHLAIQKSWRLSEPLLREQMLSELKRIITTI